MHNNKKLTEKKYYTRLKNIINIKTFIFCLVWRIKNEVSQNVCSNISSIFVYTYMYRLNCKKEPYFLENIRQMFMWDAWKELHGLCPTALSQMSVRQISDSVSHVCDAAINSSSFIDDINKTHPTEPPASFIDWQVVLCVTYICYR